MLKLAEYQEHNDYIWTDLVAEIERRGIAILFDTPRYRPGCV
jgi:L-rhamnose mutarotase